MVSERPGSAEQAVHVRLAVQQPLLEQLLDELVNNAITDARLAAVALALHRSVESIDTFEATAQGLGEIVVRHRSILCLTLGGWMQAAKGGLPHRGHTKPVPKRSARQGCEARSLALTRA